MAATFQRRRVDPAVASRGTRGCGALEGGDHRHVTAPRV